MPSKVKEIDEDFGIMAPETFNAFLTWKSQNYQNRVLTSPTFQLPDIGLDVNILLIPGKWADVVLPGIRFHRRYDNELILVKPQFKMEIHAIGFGKSHVISRSVIEFGKMNSGEVMLRPDDLVEVRKGKILDLEIDLMITYESVIYVRRLDEIRSLLEDPAMADFTFEVGGQTVPAHKAMLACRSSFFQKLFTSDESCNNLTIEDSISKDALVEFLKFIYTEKFCADLNTADLLKLAAKFNCDDLEAACEAQLVNQLTDDNAGAYFEMSHLLNLKGQLKVKAFQRIKRLLSKLNLRLDDELIEKVQKVMIGYEKYNDITKTFESLNSKPSEKKKLKKKGKGRSKKAKGKSDEFDSSSGNVTDDSDVLIEKIEVCGTVEHQATVSQIEAESKTDESREVSPATEEKLIESAAEEIETVTAQIEGKSFEIPQIIVENVESRDDEEDGSEDGSNDGSESSDQDSVTEFEEIYIQEMKNQDFDGEKNIGVGEDSDSDDKQNSSGGEIPPGEDKEKSRDVKDTEDIEEADDVKESLLAEPEMEIFEVKLEDVEDTGEENDDRSIVIPLPH